MTQGKCTRCKIGFRWDGKPRLYKAFCPYCQKRLARTTYLFKGRWENKVPFYWATIAARVGRQAP